jgi:uncharacterized protein YndB with AHSA1/START domain
VPLYRSTYRKLIYASAQEAVSMRPFVAKSNITIKADAARVWDALTNPELIKQYLFGTEAISDWKEGSSITYKGSGKASHTKTGASLRK